VAIVCDIGVIAVLKADLRTLQGLDIWWYFEGFLVMGPPPYRPENGPQKGRKSKPF